MTRTIETFTALALVALVLATLGLNARAAEFDVLVAVGIELPRGLAPESQLGVGQEVRIATGGRLLLAERTGCMLGRVFSGPARFALALTPLNQCNVVRPTEEVEQRILSGEMLAERVVLRDAGGKADALSTFSGNFSDPCLHLPALSEEAERNTRFCPRGTLLSGMRCSGSYCDDKFLRCCTYPRGAFDTASTSHATWWISEETGPGRANLYVDDAFIVGMSCRGDYCDDLLPHARRSATVRNSGICSWTPYFSEESPSHEWCETGAFVTGIACTGKYCDSLALRCCRTQGR